MVISREQNRFDYGGENSESIFTESFYYYKAQLGQTTCPLGNSSIINLLQAYWINTLVFSLWDCDARSYDLVVYAIYKGIESKIIDCSYTCNLNKVQFLSQRVDSFRFYNRGGSIYSPFLYIIKVVAYQQIY